MSANVENLISKKMMNFAQVLELKHFVLKLPLLRGNNDISFIGNSYKKTITSQRKIRISLMDEIFQASDYFLNIGTLNEI